MTNSLREEIYDILYDAQTEFWCEAADRILALLSKIPKLYWSEQVRYEKEMRYLMWGEARLGFYYTDGENWWVFVGILVDSRELGPFLSEIEAREAAELAVRKSLVGE